MLESLFSGIYGASSGSITLGGFCLSMAAALALGAVLTLSYTYRNTYTKSFVVTLAMLPAVVCLVIMMVSGSLGAGVAVAGTFSLVRFRSAPGTAREICAIFLAMALGLACGMGYPGFAALFTLVMSAVGVFYTAVGFGERKNGALLRRLRITVPESLDYTGAFDEVFAEYAASWRLLGVKTTNLGSLNRLTYELELKSPGVEKELIDALRCRNGNLEISSSLPAAEGPEL